MIKNFLFDISGCTGNYTLKGREMECLKYIKETVGSNKVLVRRFNYVSRNVYIPAVNNNHKN
jgi:hypothetical protein